MREVQWKKGVCVVWGSGQVGHAGRVRGGKARDAHACGTGRIDG